MPHGSAPGPERPAGPVLITVSYRVVPGEGPAEERARRAGSRPDAANACHSLGDMP
jgi:hypothetical protein